MTKSSATLAPTLCLENPALKKNYNEWLFTQIAPRYALATRALSLGRDMRWKRQLVEAIPASRPVSMCLDVACGTGDVTFLLADRFTAAEIIGLDLTGPMLAIANGRNRHLRVRFVQGDMCKTALPAGSVDVVTGSYALRNAPDLGSALRELRRILKPGGYAAFLDFAKPTALWSQACEYTLLKYWGMLWGLLLHGNAATHEYIAKSLSAFPDRAQLRAILEAHGFSVIKNRRFYFGVLEMIVLKNTVSGKRETDAATGQLR